jgi:hypothetical protein
LEKERSFIWEAYQRQYKAQLVAVARAPHLIWARKKVMLDGSRSFVGDLGFTRDGNVIDSFVGYVLIFVAFRDCNQRQVDS